jgi:hypothetical protein
MSDLTTLDSVKKAAKRAIEKVEAGLPWVEATYGQDRRDAMACAIAVLIQFVEELDEAMQNPREGS